MEAGASKSQRGLGLAGDLCVSAPAGFVAGPRPGLREVIAQFAGARNSGGHHQHSHDRRNGRPQRSSLGNENGHFLGESAQLHI